MARTAQEILTSMLDNIDNRYNKTTGSTYWNLCGTNSLKFNDLEVLYDELPDLMRPSRSSGEFLLSIGELYGLFPREASFATGKITIFSPEEVTVPRGSVFSRSYDDFEYTTDFEVILNNSTAIVDVTATVAGNIGNCSVGYIDTVVSDIPEISSVTNEAPLITGLDDESEYEFSLRLMQKVRNIERTGNEGDYVRWGLDSPLVTRVHCQPLERGPGTVDVIVTDKEDKEPSDEDLAWISDYYQTLRPIGADVLLKKATAESHDFAYSLILDGTKALDTVKAELREIVEKYLASMGLHGDTISYAKLICLPHEIEGVYIVENFLLDTAKDNVVVAEGSYVTIGTFDVTEPA